MSTTHQTDTLNALINSLEEQRNNQLSALKSQLHLTGESLKPTNLMKSVASEFTDNKKFKTYLIQAGIGLAIGLVTKKLLAAKAQHNSTNLVGSIADFGFSKLNLTRLTPQQISLIKVVAPIAFGMIAKLINNRKRKG